MTRTGTQADPYVPTTWAEFVTAIGTSGAYVSVPEGTVWDMNEIQPTGVGTLTVAAARIIGNGAEIKNLLFNGGGFDFTANTAISNMKFTNFLAENSSTVFKCQSFQNHVYPSLSLVTISGKLVESHLFQANYGSYTQQITLSRCAVNAEFSGESAFIFGGAGAYPWLKMLYCNINTTGSSTYTDAQDLQMQNTLWRGDWIMKRALFIGGYSGGNIISSNNIIDANVPATASVEVNSSYSSNVKQCIFNSDKIASGAAVDSVYTKLTTEQLHSASYLQGIGFPIGVESS